MTTIPRPAAHLDERPFVGVNYWSRTGGPFMWRDYDDAVVREELRTMLEHGIGLTRSFFFWPDFHPAPGMIDEAMVETYRRFLATSDELGIPTIPTFLVGHMSGQDWDVPWREGRNLYTDPFMLEQQAWFIGEMVRRLGPSPAIAGWLVTNEFTHYAGFGERGDVRRWAERCVAAIRGAGSDRPVSLGDGAWGAELTGIDNGFRLRDLTPIVDFFGPHNYKLGTDQARVHFTGAWFCELAHFGVPVILEEFGVSSTHSGETAAADLFRQNLHLSLLAGATGWMPWNNTDFALGDRQPYSHHGFELNFGLTTVDGTPKPRLGEVQRFREMLDAVDFPKTRRRPTATSVILSSFIDDHPRIPQEERPVVATITQHAYIAAKLAGLAPAVQRELDAPQRTALAIVPANKLLVSSTFDLLERWAEAGSLVYLGWFSGVSPTHRGAWWPDLADTVGMPHRLRYGLREPIDDVVEWTVEAPVGDLAAGDVLRFPFAGHPDTRHMLPLDDRDLRDGVTVLARDQRSRPALVRRAVGAGSVVVSAYAIEYFGSERPDAHLDDDVRRLYRALAIEAGAMPDVTVDAPGVVVDGIEHEDGRRFTWLVNVTAEPVTVRPAGAALTELGDTHAAVTSVDLEPFGVRVLQHR